MIDYDKLKLAHELCIPLEDYYFSVDFCVNTGSDKVDISLTNANMGIPEKLNDLDALLTKLTELTQPKPKYEVGQEVWITHAHNGISCGQIKSITNDQDGFYYHFYILETRHEKYCYPTKQALIEAQIEYWSKLFEKENPGRLLVWNQSSIEYCVSCGFVLNRNLSCPNPNCLYDIGRK